MKERTAGTTQDRFTQSSRSRLSVDMIEVVDHGVHREDLENLSVFSVRRLCDLCVKLYALPSLPADS